MQITRRCQFSLRALLFAPVAFAVAWGVTATWGVYDLKRQLLTEIETTWPDSRRIEHDPNEEEARGRSPGPPVGCHYVVNGAAEFPFVVAVDSGVMRFGLFGGGGREYYLWLPGVRWQIAYAPHWGS